MAFKALGKWRERVMDRLFGDLVGERVYNAVQVVDDEYWSQIHGGAATLDEDWNARKESLDDALDAWRSNPLARRIVSLCTDYVVGSGIVLQSELEWVNKFVSEFWALNRIGERMYEWCDELTRAGELFIVMRTDPVSGASFVRSMPAVWIDQVFTDPDDYERELRFHQTPASSAELGSAGRWWPVARP